MYEYICIERSSDEPRTSIPYNFFAINISCLYTIYLDERQNKILDAFYNIVKILEWTENNNLFFLRLQLFFVMFESSY